MAPFAQRNVAKFVVVDKDDGNRYAATQLHYYYCSAAYSRSSTSTSRNSKRKSPALEAGSRAIMRPMAHRMRMAHFLKRSMTIANN
jgi:hypothetical protein